LATEMMDDMRSEGWAGSGRGTAVRLSAEKGQAPRDRKRKSLPQSPGWAGYFFFFADFLAGRENYSAA
jgi:hypothetical protein